MIHEYMISLTKRIYCMLLQRNSTSLQEIESRTQEFLMLSRITAQIL